MDGIITIANGSSSSLYGCIGYAVQDIILSKFPAKYFKYTSVSSELATRNIRRTFGGNNSKVEIAKRQKPYLIIQPTYSVMDMDGPLQNIPLTKNFDDLEYRIDKRYLFEVIKDFTYGYNLKFKLNRDRIEFDVTVTTSTLHQQLDIYRTMLNQIMWDRSYAHRMALESIIPKKIISIISKYCNMDYSEHEEYIPILLKRLNSCSGYPITYKLRNASASDEWFMYYTHNVIITFTDLNIESGNKKNMSDDSYNITFKVIAEFNMPGVYIIDGDLEPITANQISLSDNAADSEDSEYSPMYVVDNLFSRFPPEMDGMRLYGTTIFKTSASANQLEDRIDIKSVLDTQHMRVLRAHRAWNMNPDTLMNIYVLKNGDTLIQNTDYYIDWNTLELVVKTIDNSATYRLIIYFNYSTVNEILNNTAYMNNFDVDKLKRNKFPETGITEDVFIYGEDDDYEQISNNIYDEGKVPDDKKDDPEVVELIKDPTYCAGDEHTMIEDPDIILFKNKVIINSDDGRYKAPSKDMFLPDHVDPSVNDPYILEDDPTYCADEEHEKVDAEDIIYGNVIMLNNDEDNFRAPMKNTYMKGYVPRDKVGDPDVYSVTEDDEYCDHQEHERVDAAAIIYEDRLILNNDPDRFTSMMANAYMADKVPADKVDDPNTIIVNKDLDYCGDEGISISEIEIADIPVPTSTADIHNSAVSKKRFSSSI